MPAGGVELRQASLLASELPGFVPENDLSGLRLSLGRDSQGPSETVALLDSQTPRPLDERGRVLESLLNENLELGPGYHRVVVVQARPDEVIHQSHVFSYVAKGSGDPELPPCVLYRPAGTYNGPVASNSIELLALPLGQGVTRFRYRMRGSGFDDELEAEVGRVVAAKEASSGDYRVEVDCVGQDGGTLATLKRIITVNREVILPQESD